MLLGSDKFYAPRVLMRKAERSTLCLCTVTSLRCLDTTIDTTLENHIAHLKLRLILK